MSSNPWKQRILAFNRKRAEADEKANDLVILLNALPSGQLKQLMKDETCYAILLKYGVVKE